MAFFSTKLQIPCSLISQGKQSSKLSKYNTRNLGNLISSSNFRSVWSWSWTSKKKSRQGRPTICGKELPESLTPYNPECPSKCLQIKNCKDKEAAKRKLTNCRDVETATENKSQSYFANFFDQKSINKKSVDPCTCRVINHEKKISREKNPRLRDPRYEMTDGDVFIFTECCRKKNRKSPREPLPKPPPSYKIPKAVFTQRFVRQMEITPNNCVIAWQFEDDCNNQSPKCSALKKTPTLPFEELRPPERQRYIYFCKDGVRPEVVPKPPKNNSYCCGAFKSNSYQQKIADSPLQIDVQNHSIALSHEIHSAREKSRVEQLKKLTRANEESSCCSKSFANMAEETNCSSQIIK